MKRWNVYFAFILLTFVLTGCDSENQNPFIDNKDNVPTDFVQKDDIADLEVESTITESVHFMSYGVEFMQEGYTEERESYLHKKENGTVFETYDGTYSQVQSFYEAGLESDELYAFIVDMGNYENECPVDYPVQQEEETHDEFYRRKEEYLANKALEVMSQTDLYIVEDYPYSYDMIHYAGPYAIYSPKTKTFSQPEGYGLGVCVVGRIKDFVELCENGKAINGWYCRFIPATRPDVVELVSESPNEKCLCDIYGHHLLYYFLEDATLNDKREVIVTVELQKP